MSPPTDLAALYQQIGRAGRDAGRRDPGSPAPVNSGLALATSRGMRMVRFMTGQELPPSLLRRTGHIVLAQRGGTLDPVRLAETLMADDAATGELTEADLEDRYVQDRYRGGVMRAFSALADLAAVEDLGDHPPYCAIKPGDLGPAPRAADQPNKGPSDPVRIERAVVDIALSWDTPGKVDVQALDRELAARCPDYRSVAEGPAATWELLADLHDRGLLDVSAAPSRRLVTGLTVLTDTLPDGYLPLLRRRGSRAAAELAELGRFFDATTVCAQRAFGDYFGVGDIPEGCCATAACRCSACWNAGDHPVDERRPAVADAFYSPRGGSRTDTALRERRIDIQIHRLLQLQPSGAHPRRLWHALRGDESSYNPRQHKMIPLPRVLRESRHFGGRADLPYASVGEGLTRLAGSGVAAEGPDGLWRAIRPARQAPGSSAREEAGA
ncbi:hypothetical protein OG462_41695 [Streptomyces sp. NBC_01077]|uniref:hypothetical protein n=1 Tax=Streptomyces sp. NBC_01077 TaxID=2903746 RepID=UPI00386768C9|nr:hypothetical protein OG462_41695 [Streptomyces sp. NBC_01077]